MTVTYRASGQWSVSGGSGAGVDDYPSALAGVTLAAQNKPQAYYSIHVEGDRDLDGFLSTL